MCREDCLGTSPQKVIVMNPKTALSNILEALRGREIYSRLYREFDVLGRAVGELPAEHWTLSIASDEQLHREVMDWMNENGLHDPLIHHLRSIMERESMPLTNILFTAAVMLYGEVKTLRKGMERNHRFEPWPPRGYCQADPKKEGQ